MNNSSKKKKDTKWLLYLQLMLKDTYLKVLLLNDLIKYLESDEYKNLISKKDLIRDI